MKYCPEQALSNFSLRRSAVYAPSSPAILFAPANIFPFVVLAVKPVPILIRVSILSSRGWALNSFPFPRCHSANAASLASFSK